MAPAGGSDNDGLALDSAVLASGLSYAPIAEYCLAWIVLWCSLTQTHEKK